MSPEQRIETLEFAVRELQAQLTQLQAVLRRVIEDEQCKQMVSAHWQEGDC
jgi:hypothetical protein